VESNCREYVKEATLKKFPFFVMLVLVIAWTYGCSRPVAEVNGEKISKKSYEMVLNESKRQHSARGNTVTSDSLRDAVIQQLIGETLLIQSAKEAGITVSNEDVQNEFNKIESAAGKENLLKQLEEKGITVQDFKDRLLKQMILNKYIGSLVPEDSITDHEMKDFYKQTPKMFIHPKQVNVRLIETKTEAEANALLQELKSKKISFDALADRLQKEQKSSVTAYGWTDPSFYSESIREGMKKLAKGAYGGPYKGKASYFIIRLKDRKNESPKTFDEAKDEIRRLLLDQKRNATFLHLIEEKKKNADIKIHLK